MRAKSYKVRLHVSTSSSSMLERAQKEIAFPSVLTRFYQSHRQKICL